MSVADVVFGRMRAAAQLGRPAGALLCAVALGLLAAGIASASGAVRAAQPLRTIPVQACNGETQGVPYKFHGPSTVGVRLSAADAARLVAFNGIMLAPRGWHCDYTAGSGGATLKAYSARGGFFPSNTGGYQPQEAVSVYYATTGNHALYQACPYFPEAAAELKRMRMDCGSYVEPTPLGETQTHRNVDEIDFSDPPRIRLGTGDPSGGRNRALGLELFDSTYESSKGGYVDNASTATCTLAPSDQHLCSAILAYVRTQFARLLNETH